MSAPRADILGRTTRPRQRKNREPRSFAFVGCAFSLSGDAFRDNPVGLSFLALDSDGSSAETVHFHMSMDAAERVHRVLGEMIERRKRQAAK